MAHGEPVLYSLYVYAPNQQAPVFFAVAYAVSAVFHIWQCYRYRAFRLIGIHPICAVIFTAAYGLRVYGSHHYLFLSASDTATLDTTALKVFIVSQAFTFACPPLLELANYYVLGRTFRYVPYLAPLRPDRVVALFASMMAIIELFNAVGVQFVVNPTYEPYLQSVGRYLSLTSVSLQLLQISTFFALTTVFHWRCARANLLARSRTLRTLTVTLYGSMALILARTVYRLVEYTGNTHIDYLSVEALYGLSPILRYEVFFYIFEASLMLVNSTLWNVWHPGRFLPRSTHVYLGRDGNEAEGSNVVNDRPAWKKAAFFLTYGLRFGPRQDPTSGSGSSPQMQADHQGQHVSGVLRAESSGVPGEPKPCPSAMT